MKYKLIDNSVNYSYPYRIVALKDFKDIRVGDEGGIVYDATTLSQEGNCWIYKHAKVSKGSYIRDNAVIKDTAIILEGCTIGDNAYVGGTVVVGPIFNMKNNDTLSYTGAYGLNKFIQPVHSNNATVTIKYYSGSNDTYKDIDISISGNIIQHDETLEILEGVDKLDLYGIAEYNAILEAAQYIDPIDIPVPVLEEEPIVPDEKVLIIDPIITPIDSSGKQFTDPIVYPTPPTTIDPGGSTTIDPGGSTTIDPGGSTTIDPGGSIVEQLIKFGENVMLMDTIDDMFACDKEDGDKFFVSEYGRGGIFTYDSSKVSENNGITNLNGYIRYVENNTIHALWHEGVKNDGTDCGDSIQEVIDFAKTQGLKVFSDGTAPTTVYFRDGHYKSNPFAICVQVNLLGESMGSTRFYIDNPNGYMVTTTWNPDTDASLGGKTIDGLQYLSLEMSNMSFYTEDEYTSGLLIANGTFLHNKFTQIRFKGPYYTAGDTVERKTTGVHLNAINGNTYYSIYYTYFNGCVIDDFGIASNIENFANATYFTNSTLIHCHNVIKATNVDGVYSVGSSLQTYHSNTAQNNADLVLDSVYYMSITGGWMESEGAGPYVRRRIIVKNTVRVTRDISIAGAAVGNINEFITDDVKNKIVNWDFGGVTDMNLNIDKEEIVKYDENNVEIESLGNGWVNYGDLEETAGYSVQNNILHIVGFIKDGVDGTLFTLPSEISNRIHSRARRSVVLNDGTIAKLTIGIDGVVEISGTTKGEWVYLNSTLVLSPPPPKTLD